MRQRSSAAHGETVHKRVEPGQALSRQPVSQRRLPRSVHACGTVIWPLMPPAHTNTMPAPRRLAYSTSSRCTAAVVVWWGLGRVAGQFPGQPTGGDIRYRDMVRSRHRVSTRKLLVFILPIAILLLIIIMFVPGPRELIGAMSHTVSQRLNPVRPSPTSAPTLTPTLTPASTSTSTSTSTLTPNTCTTSSAKGSCGPYTVPQISGINGEVTVGNNVWNPIPGWSETLIPIILAIGL